MGSRSFRRSTTRPVDPTTIPHTPSPLSIQQQRVIRSLKRASKTAEAAGMPLPVFDFTFLPPTDTGTLDDTLPHLLGDDMRVLSSVEFEKQNEERISEQLSSELHISKFAEIEKLHDDPYHEKFSSGPHLIHNNRRHTISNSNNKQSPSRGRSVSSGRQRSSHSEYSQPERRRTMSVGRRRVSTSLVSSPSSGYSSSASQRAGSDFTLPRLDGARPKTMSASHSPSDRRTFVGKRPSQSPGTSSPLSKSARSPLQRDSSPLSNPMVATPPRAKRSSSFGHLDFHRNSSSPLHSSPLTQSSLRTSSFRFNTSHDNSPTLEQSMDPIVQSSSSNPDHSKHDIESYFHPHPPPSPPPQSQTRRPSFPGRPRAFSGPAVTSDPPQ
ncbi:hypothetical protein ADUPG1_011337, partial [Aduncisulcus paluster]